MSARRLRSLLEVLRAHGDADAPRTAESLAKELGVSTRTLYRDLDRLREAGVGVQAKAGVGVRFPDEARLSSGSSGSSASNGASDSPRLGVRADVRATPKGLRALRHDPELALDPGRGDGVRSVRAPSRESLIVAVLRSAGEIVLVGPPKLRREVRTRARAIARAHKGKE